LYSGIFAQQPFLFVEGKSFSQDFCDGYNQFHRMIQFHQITNAIPSYCALSVRDRLLIFKAAKDYPVIQILHGETK